MVEIFQQLFQQIMESSYTTSGYNYWRIISGTGTSNNTIASGGDTNNGSLLDVRNLEMV
jgi:hypothetical protein